MATTLVNAFVLYANLQHFGFYFNDVDGNNNPDFPDTLPSFTTSARRMHCD